MQCTVIASKPMSQRGSIFKAVTLQNRLSLCSKDLATMNYSTRQKGLLSIIDDNERLEMYQPSCRGVPNKNMTRIFYFAFRACTSPSWNKKRGQMNRNWREMATKWWMRSILCSHAFEIFWWRILQYLCWWCCTSVDCVRADCHHHRHPCCHTLPCCAAVVVRDGCCCSRC
jgi:hypothetical protein